MAKVDWDTNEYETSSPRNFDALPKGRYLAQVEDTEMKDTKKGDGKYLEVTFVVLAPKDSKGRKLWARLNTHNPSEVAQRIGREQFNALCVAATGSLSVSKTESLHNKKVVLHVSVERDKQTEEMRNRIDGYEALSADSQPSSPAEKPAAAKPAAKPAAAKPSDDLDDDIPF